MHAYLFTGGEAEVRERRMRKAAQKKGEIFEFSLQKIADVRDLSSFTKLSQKNPISILIKSIDTATLEASNAFLKNLEEPGNNIFYFLSCDREQSLLPTIVSRCHVVKIGPSSTKTNPQTAQSFLKMSFGQKIIQLSKLKKKDEAKKYLRELSLSAHSMLINKKGEIRQSALLLKAAQKALYNLSLNANVNLQMTVFAVKTTKS